jgi:acetylglutamate kinase
MGVTARAIHGSDSLGPGTDHPVATFARKTVVITYGGAAMEGVRLLDGFVRDIAALRSAGIDLVVVHGGRMRVTDDETMELVERALRQVNDEIAQMINRHGARAMGLSAGPGPLIHARHRMHRLPTGESVDLGRVGDVAGVNTTPIRARLGDHAPPHVRAHARTAASRPSRRSPRSHACRDRTPSRRRSGSSPPRAGS